MLVMLTTRNEFAALTFLFMQLSMTSCGATDSSSIPGTPDARVDTGQPDARMDAGVPDAGDSTCEDGVRNGDEVDVDCGGSCAPCPSMARSCAELLESGSATDDGEYTIDPDGPGGDEPFPVYCDMTSFGGGWTRCLRFLNGTSEDLDSNDWLDDCVDYTMASWTGEELFLVLRALDGSVVYEATGVREGDWSYDALTCQGLPGEQDVLSEHAPVELSTGDWLVLPGRSGNNGGCSGAIANGYAVLVYRENAVDARYPKLLAVPYTLQVGANQGAARPFGLLGSQWFPSNEISYDGASTWDTCELLPAFLGVLELYVR